MSLGTKTLLALVLGLLAGAAISVSASPVAASAGRGVALLGTLWIHAILMTIVPLVVSSLVATLAEVADPGTIGRTGGRALAIFLAFLGATAILSIAAAPALFALLPIDAATVAALKASAESAPGGAAGAPPSVAEWIVGLVPSNAIRAAADGAMLPLVVFSICFGVAAGHVAPERRRTLVEFFRAVGDAMSALLGWIVRAAPVGIFALSLGLVLEVGLGIVGAVGYYVLAAALLQAAITLLLPVVVRLVAGIPMRRFSAAASEGWVVGFSTHSSLAALPALFRGARERLGLPAATSDFAIPLSAALFKYASPCWFVTVAFFLAKLYGVTLDAPHLAAVVAVSIVASFTVSGTPSSSAYLVAPVLLAAGLPASAMGLLLGVDAIPNAFRSATNAASYLAVTALVAPRSTSSGSSGR